MAARESSAVPPPADDHVTVLVEPGTESAELVNLMYRQNVSPSLAPAAAPPSPDPKRILALVACGIHPPRALFAMRSWLTRKRARRWLPTLRGGEAVVANAGAQAGSGRGRPRAVHPWPGPRLRLQDGDSRSERVRFRRDRLHPPSQSRGAPLERSGRDLRSRRRTAWGRP